jgi:hypothetical protein
MRRSKAEVKEHSDVADPILRAVNYIRRRTSRSSGAAPLDRFVGEFKKPTAETSEPWRTERLLNAPFTLFHTTASDAYDSISLFCLLRSTHMGCVSIHYDVIFLIVSQCLAVALGMQSFATKHNAEQEQGLVVVSLQIGLSLFILLLRPSIDRLENMSSGAQLATEGLGTLLLLMPILLGRKAPWALSGAFSAALAAVAIPLIVIAYDSVVVPVYTTVPEGGGIRAVFSTLKASLLAIPGYAASLEIFARSLAHLQGFPITCPH